MAFTQLAQESNTMPGSRIFAWMVHAESRSVVQLQQR